MLFLTGSSFETIAKWIGHSSPQVTSAIYGRLSHRDAEASLGNVPFLAPRNPDVVSEWAGLAEFPPGSVHCWEPASFVRPTTLRRRRRPATVGRPSR